MNLDDAALVVIDVQNDFCPGGALEVPEGDAVVPVINRIAPKFSARILRPGLASARPSLLRFQPRRQGAVRDRPSPLRRAGAVARPLRAGHRRGGLPSGPRDRRRRSRHSQGVPSRDRLLLRVLRERPEHVHGTRRVPAQPRHLPAVLRRARHRLLRRVVRDRRHPGRLRMRGHRGRVPGHRPGRVDGRRWRKPGSRCDTSPIRRTRLKLRRRDLRGGVRGVQE